jgi:hypothetical protein
MMSGLAAALGHSPAVSPWDAPDLISSVRALHVKNVDVFMYKFAHFVLRVSFDESKMWHDSGEIISRATYALEHTARGQ